MQNDFYREVAITGFSALFDVILTSESISEAMHDLDFSAVSRRVKEYLAVLEFRVVIFELPILRLQVNSTSHVICFLNHFQISANLFTNEFIGQRQHIQLRFISLRLRFLFDLTFHLLRLCLHKYIPSTGGCLSLRFYRL